MSAVSRPARIMSAEPITVSDRADRQQSTPLGSVARLWARTSARRRRMLFGLMVAAVLPFLSEVLADILDRALDVHAPNMIFLCSVIFAAIGFGRVVGLFSAFCAFLVYNFYLTEPRGMIGFAGWEDVLTLLVFVGVALVVGGLAGNLHDERDLAREQVRIFSNLFSVSRPLAECDDAEEALRLLESGARQMAAEDVILVSASCGVIADARTVVSAPPSLIQTAQEMLRDQERDEREVDGWWLQPVLVGDRRVATLAWLPQRRVAVEQLAIAVRLLSEMAGIAIERALYIESKLELETIGAAEKLRTALMSSISHDFRTPLSTIITSSSSLLTYGAQFSPATQEDLLHSIQEEAERLNRFVSNILDMTRLDAGVVKPRLALTDPLEVLDNLQERMRRRLATHTFVIDAPAAVPSIFVDTLLLEQALVNAVENALVHASGSAIRVGAAYGEDDVSLWVEDEGSGVPAGEITNIFDKFRRLSSAESGQGAGLGLAISKGFVEAMQGKIEASSPARDGKGLRVTLSFPRAAEAAL